MRYMLDTNTCIYIIKRKPKDVLEKFQTIAPFDIGISSITVAELEYGAAKSQFPDRNRAALNLILVTNNTKEFNRVQDLALENW